MNNELMFSSKTDLWETPQDFFDGLDNEFHFTLDVCALPENAKCERYFTPEIDGLKQEWTGTVWCNPPYGREIGSWVRRAYLSAKTGYATVVMLLPARTDTKWFHEYIYGKAEIRFIKGRLKFGGCKNSAPFPSMVAIFRAFEILNPCPVCGSHNVSTEIIMPVWSDRCKHLAKCHNCGLRTGFEETEHSAIQKWNSKDVYGVPNFKEVSQ